MSVMQQIIRSRPWNRLWVRLTIAFSLVVVIGVTTYAMIDIWLSIQELNDLEEQGAEIWGHGPEYQFIRPGGVIDALESYYEAQRSWDEIDSVMSVVQSFNVPNPVQHVSYSFRNNRDEVLFTTHPENIDEWRRRDFDHTFPIAVDGQVRGYLRVLSLNNFTDFDRAQTPTELFTIWLEDWLQTRVRVIAAVGIIFGVLFSVFISRSMTAPLRRLSDAAQAIGAHDLSRRVSVRGTAEVNRLSSTFNQMAEELETGERLRRTLMADVAHELRTPLTVLQGNLRAILDDVYPLTKTEVAGLYDQTRLLSRLVADLHDLARAEAHKLPLNMDEIDLTNLVDRTSATFGPLAEADGVTLNIDTAVPLPVHGDQARLAQVLHNLLANALHHTPEGGSIFLRAEREEGCARLTIKDTGSGIPAEHLPHVFDRFYRADRSRSRNRGGAGLGLAISKAIVEAHGGDIAVDSEGVRGFGTTFIVRLPLIPDYARQTITLSRSGGVQHAAESKEWA